MEIVERKSKAAVCQLQSEDNLAKEKEVKALATIILQTKQDSAVALENEIRL